jgi:hypothetical protein
LDHSSLIRQSDFVILHSMSLAMRIFLALLCCSTLIARADDRWTLTTADFRRSSVVLREIDAKGARVLPSGAAEKTIPLDSLVRLERDGYVAASTPKFTLFLRNGDRIGGEPGDLKDELLTWMSGAAGEIKVDLSTLLAISRSASPPSLAADRKEDQVILSNHDVVRGTVAGFEDGKILIQSGGDTVPVPLASAESIFFATSAKGGAAPAHEWRVRLADASVFTVPALQVADGNLLFRLHGEKSADARSTELENVLSIEQINGPVSWLSDRTPRVNQQVPFNSEVTYPARMNLNVFGKPLRVGAQIFEQGIGVHANSVLTFTLDGSYKLFRTRYAIDTTSDVSKAVVNVRVLLDGRVVHEEKNFKAFKMSPVLTVDLGGAKELTLEVTAAGATDTEDRLDWIEPALVREAAPADAPATAPATVTPPATGTSDKAK